MKKYKVYYYEGDLKILVARDLSIDECRELIGQQQDPGNYKIEREEEEVSCDD